MMVDQNSRNLNTVYQKAEELFARVELSMQEYLPWCALGALDIQAYIEENFTTVEDWEANF